MANIHVRVFRDEGTMTTPFDMVLLNNLDRCQLALDAIQLIPRLSSHVEAATAGWWTLMERHKLNISEHGDDMPEVRERVIGLPGERSNRSDFRLRLRARA
jgi:xylulose-5-phosphate/fructose-6-phosphate phosphoketolase